MEFPNLVYRCPGTHQCKGGTFNYRQVTDEKQLAAAVNDGWFETLEEAIAGKKKEPAAEQAADSQPIEQPAADDGAPPTRAELEQKATELQIKFDGRTSDKKLTDLIAATLEQ